ncbi:MAG TPA: sensor histidine kinase [Cyclobacteriaceae bacterium]|nr:sensor histidine kinase [Cyclobacteriaceae bacterium]HPW61017.1 sensor histidine kinase [Cyclobacteriaceae bacterium]
MRFITGALLTSLFLMAMTLSAQDYYDRDSLWRVFEKSQMDTNRVHLYIQLGQQYETNNPDSALLLYEQALKLSQQLNYTRGIISYYTNATYVYNILGNYDTALILNLKSVEIARAFGDPERLAACLGNVGATYISMQQHEKALEYQLQIIPLYEKLNNQIKLSTLYSNLSYTYSNIKQYKKAIEYGEMSLRIGRQIKNDYSITTTLVNLSTVYILIGQTERAIKALEEARAIARRTNNQYALLITSLNLGDANIKLGNYNKLQPYYDEALTLANKLGDQESVVIALRGKGLDNFYKKKIVEAELFINQSLQLAVANSMIDQIGKGYTVLADIAVLKGDFRTNNYYAIKSDSIRTLLLNESIAENIQELEAKYESEKKEQQIKQLEQEADIKDLSIKQNRLLNFILVGSLLAVLAIVMLARRTYQQKKKILEKENSLNQSRIAELEKEKQLMASEAVIKGQDEERGRLAKDLHDGLGGLLSGVKFSLANMKSTVILDADSALVFERSLDMLDHSISELRRVAHNMMPEVLVKFGLSEALKSYCDRMRESQTFKIDFQSIGMEERLSSNTEIFVYRIVQELLNNTAKHAKATHVLVQLARQNNEVSITVEDDGSGFDKTMVDKATGAGWGNIRSRVDYLKGKLDILSAAGQGTSVHITIPVS